MTFHKLSNITCFEVISYFASCFYLKINKFIQSSQARVYFFNSIPAKNTNFKLNKRFVFHRNWAVDLQSIIKLSHLIHDILTNSNKVRSSVYILLFILLCLHGWIVSAICFTLASNDSKASCIPIHVWSLWWLI